MIHARTLIRVSAFLCLFTPLSLADDGSAARFWSAIKGTPGEDSLYLGMFTLHFNSHSLQKDNANNQLVGIDYNGYFGGAFKNSYSKLTVALGLQRQLFTSKLGQPGHFVFGYRIGALIGYDERLCSYCGKTLALPFVIPFINMSYKRLGVELQYAYILSSVSFFYRFGNIE